MKNLDLFNFKLQGIFQHFEQNHKKKTAIFCAVASQIFFTAMYFCVTLLKGEYSSMQIINMRMITGFIFNTMYCQTNKIEVYSDQSKVFKLLTLRGLLGGLNMTFVFTCFTLMTISDGSILVNTSPIWTNFLAAIFLGEQLSKKAVGFCMLSFVGIILVCRPAFLFGQSESSEDKNQFLGTIYGLAGSFFVSLVAIVIRKLSKYNCNGAMHMQYHYFISIFFTSIILLTDSERPFVITFKFCITMLILSFSGFVAQLLQSKALSLEKASIISPMKYLQVLFSFLIDIFVLKSEVFVTSIVGAGLIILGSVGIVI
ncbi:integral membrane protein DUF6 containing protein (macronuclear) [Tetrahymena thermophila SB210]|uniref:Integral membrane protein DUF6 containing protein n=1 Tax=Tetrahymena thermophila (strain SB210) TaxID=312017 RepID=Q23H46_TETTS|nr:integral membrane protein DUF6 containing protein [Tetrahymena thermophila SB210]EAR95801.1 integral membrane protein DUF6 containing protein [Tetrahymena thermophila SB210]|eukprot:XP_001016046.1 integral membrane protein DUF6 containing protein [Tetrahymena thermophila SB210]